MQQNVEIGDVEAFKQALEQDGFTVQQGQIGYLDIIKLYDAGVLPSAYGNNPSTKYLTYFVPPAPGGTVPELFSRITKALGMRQDISAFWNLGPDEAVVFVGRTPPECKYFSFDHYLLSRTYGNEARWIFANLADTVNNLVINTKERPMQRLEIPSTKLLLLSPRLTEELINASRLLLYQQGIRAIYLTHRCFPHPC